jgi:opacity protein-like surface antigen
MKRAKIFVAAMAVLAMLAGAVQAEVYVEAYLGGNFTPSTSQTIGVNHNVPGFPIGEQLGTQGMVDGAFQGGLKIGTWFVKEGFLGFNYPDWMKYLGFNLDFSYHRVVFKDQRWTSNVNTFPGGSFALPAGFLNTGFNSEGNAATLAFMFAFRYGFFPDSEVPFGRLQPYVAVGPAILFSSQQPQIRSYSIFLGPYTAAPDSESSVDIALAAEAGLRYMALKNVSIDLSFKYRYAKPTYSYSFNNQNTFFNTSFSMKPTFNFLSLQVGAAYHF